jgi:hypothetical protein
MVYKIKWLEEARQSLDAEMEYVYAEFGQLTLSKVYNDLMRRVSITNFSEDWSKMRGLGLSWLRDADAPCEKGHHCLCDCQQYHRDFVRLEQPASPEPVGEGVGVGIVACLRHATDK